MDASRERPVGLTRDVGYQIGVRKTLPVAHEAAWQRVTSEEGVACWLGAGALLTFVAGETYRLADGTEGEVRVCTPGSHVRLTWRPKGWARATTIQVRVMPRDGRTVVAFHQEHLPSTEQRERRRSHFQAALAALEQMA